MHISHRSPPLPGILHTHTHTHTHTHRRVSPRSITPSVLYSSNPTPTTPGRTSGISPRLIPSVLYSSRNSLSSSAAGGGTGGGDGGGCGGVEDGGGGWGVHLSDTVAIKGFEPGLATAATAATATGGSPGILATPQHTGLSGLL